MTKTTRKILMTRWILIIPTFSIAQMDTPQGEALLNTSPEIQTFMEKINLFTEIPGEGEAISRADATKLFMQYFSTIQKESWPLESSLCVFSDITSLSTPLQQSIKDSCAYGLFKGNRGKFSPHQSLTRAQALAVLSRIDGADLIEGNPRRKGYYDLAIQKKRYQAEKITTSIEKNITKEEFVHLLYSFDTITYPIFPIQNQSMSGTQATFTPLSNTSRTLKEVDKKAVSGDYTLTFSDRLMSTKFCNGIWGTYTITGENIQGDFVSTEMLCFDEEKTGLEKLFALSGTTFLITTTTSGESVSLEYLTLTTTDNHTFKYLKKAQPLGGQKDEHGCYLGAGYSRNEEAQECQRPWEQTTPSGTTSPLDNTQWKLESFNGNSLTGSYFIAFQSGQLSTKFCNSIQGSYTLSGELINGTLISTLMGCLAEEPTMLEKGFSIDTGSLVVHNDTLTLTTHENVYVRKTTPTLK